MTAFAKLTAQKDSFLEVFRETLREAEEKAPVENYATLSIQRVYRGVVSRENMARKSFKANEVQRVFRGHLGRLQSRQRLSDKQERRQLSLFNYLCIQIQRCFRGYYSRKHKHDQARRREYVRMIVQQGEVVRRSMAQYAQDLAEREEGVRIAEKEQHFRDLAKDLHHLVSTRRIPGVYQPSTYFNNEPRMNDVPIEEHVRGVVKDLLRTRGVAHRGLETDLNGTKKIPLKGLKYRLSIQASAPYDAVLQEERRQKHLIKLIATQAGKGSFAAGGRTAVINQNTDPLCKGNPYMDPWSNPMLVKGVPRDQAELMASAHSHKPLFVRKLEQPFFTRTGGNKSTALPNDVFDTIADAEETGGAVQRFRGALTSRFGLSANCDNRTDGTIPPPPIRTSVLQFSTKTKLHKMNLKLRQSGRMNIGGSYPTFKTPLDDASLTSNMSSLASQQPGDDESSSDEEPLFKAAQEEEAEEL
ncbi:hypothetical protein B484DRAFT_403764 [Ochromonadaceae sp. CCMP2298]|nr:hypothetical protein B484DRAFT_403764 [Ochromonadaceae sp. CCMP2298]|mmetsp:Transcript_23352/g.51853  ORF Transcript_23352/g.51853 Transcript_23352/m.51853 type:complete len:472 (-) Transcript_23352:106-1521(-)